MFIYQEYIKDYIMKTYLPVLLYAFCIFSPMYIQHLFLMSSEKRTTKTHTEFIQITKNTQNEKSIIGMFRTISHSMRQ